MKYFFDTEFIEWSGTISLVSLGIISEDKRTFYAESCNFDVRNADDWVKENVIRKLKFWGTQRALGLVESSFEEQGNGKKYKTMELFDTDANISKAVLEFIGDDKNPEFYAYYGAYDWVVFARLFGRLIEKPEHFPMFVMDLKQMMVERGLDKDWKDKVCPEPQGEHHALTDAAWNLELYRQIMAVPVRNEYEDVKPMHEKIYSALMLLNPDLKPFDEFDAIQKEMFVFLTANIGNNKNASESFDDFAETMRERGYRYGREYNEQQKEHPLITFYNELIWDTKCMIHQFTTLLSMAYGER